MAFDNNNDNNNDHTSNKDINNNKTDKNDHITIVLKILIIEILSNSSSNHMKDHQGTREPGLQIIIMIYSWDIYCGWPLTIIMVTIMIILIIRILLIN